MRLAAAVIEDGDDRCIIPELVPLSQREGRSALATTSWRDEDAMKKSVLMEIEEITQYLGMDTRRVMQSIVTKSEGWKRSDEEEDAGYTKSLRHEVV